MQNKVAIIGSDAFLSKYLVEELSAYFHIVGYSRSNRQKLAIHIQFEYPRTGIDFQQLLGFDHIIYAAGSGIQAGFGEDFLYELNTFLPIELALFLSKNGFKGKYITFGSYAEIGNNQEETAFDEEAVVASSRPVPNNYGVSKRLLSRFFQSASLQINFFHLILPTIYGVGENPNRLIPYLVNSLKNKQRPRLTGGYQTRQYIHTKDVSVLLRNLLTSSDIQSGIYNVPSYETCQVKDIIQSIYQELKADESLQPESLQRFDETMKYLALDARKLKNQFPEWKPAISILDSLDEYLNAIDLK